MTSFNPGDRVFLIDGTECEYVAAVDDKHAVRRVYEDDGEAGFGDVTLVRAVYAKAPTAKLDAEVARLNGIVAELAAKVAAARAEEEELRRGAKERQALLAQHKATERIADFIAGKITHFVVFSWNGVDVVDTAAAVNCMEYGKWTGETKLLTLFGRHRTDGGWSHKETHGLEWRLDRWHDGSGGSPTRVIPCMSHEQAMEEARRYYAEVFIETADENARRNWPDAAKSAAKLGIDLPAHVVEHNRNVEIKNTREALASYEAKAAETRAALAALEASPPAVQP